MVLVMRTQYDHTHRCDTMPIVSQRAKGFDQIPIILHGSSRGLPVWKCRFKRPLQLGVTDDRLPGIDRITFLLRVCLCQTHHSW